MQLSPIEIKVRILQNGDSIAGLARQWGTTREVLSRVIHRSDEYIYPEVREKLARIS
jgi:lambda repressor-like predicted transcriptional regulator